MTKKTKSSLILSVILSVMFLLSACGLLSDKQETEELIGTLSSIYVRLTLQANEIETLKTNLADVAPSSCPECEPCATYEPCTEATPCPESTPCPSPEPCPVCEPTPTPTPVHTGSISGSLNYPSEYIPSQRVVAYNESTGYYFWVTTALGDASYKISGLPPGNYKVISYLMDSDNTKAGYTVYAACNYTCAEDHTLVIFELKDGEQKTGIDPIDWYAGEDTGWPARPGN